MVRKRRSLANAQIENSDCVEWPVLAYSVEKLCAAGNYDKLASECPSHAHSETLDLGKTKTTRLRRATFSAPLPTKEFFNSIGRFESLDFEGILL